MISKYTRKNVFAFTIIELVVVLVVVSALFGLINISSGTVTHWSRESFIRKLSETMEYLHFQAINDNQNYRIEFHLEEDQHFYQIGMADNEGGIIPIPDLPSLAEPVYLPADTYFVDLRTAKGLEDGSSKEPLSLSFHSQGFSDFGALHIGMYNKNNEVGYITIFVNPFTGLTKIYREYKDFEYTYKQNDEK